MNQRRERSCSVVIDCARPGSPHRDLSVGPTRRDRSRHANQLPNPCHNEPGDSRTWRLSRPELRRGHQGPSARPVQRPTSHLVYENNRKSAATRSRSPPVGFTRRTAACQDADVLPPLPLLECQLDKAVSNSTSEVVVQFAGHSLDGIFSGSPSPVSAWPCGDLQEEAGSAWQQPPASRGFLHGPARRHCSQVGRWGLLTSSNVHKPSGGRQPYNIETSEPRFTPSGADHFSHLSPKSM